MGLDEEYKLRYFYGMAYDNSPNYEYIDINENVYKELLECFLKRKFIEEVETSYEYIVSNYRDYELFNYSAALNHYLELDVDPYRNKTAENNSDRHITNILTSTYLYLCVLRLNPSKKDIEAIACCKNKFKEMTNRYHEEKYQYTFMSALRNKINHGGTLSSATQLSPTWSVRYGESDSDDTLIVGKKDKRHLFFDHVVTKIEAKRLMKPMHYSRVEASMPEKFYLREATRLYIDSLSNMHAEIRSYLKDLLDSTNAVLSRPLKNREEYVTVSLIKNIKGISGEINIGSPVVTKQESRQKAKAPLYLEYMALPGENSAVL
jgi:hypothetical protein